MSDKALLTESAAVALKPCPFCGGKAERIDINVGENTGGSCVECTRCHASSNVEFEFKENFVSNWNTRPPTSGLEGMRERYARIIGSWLVYDDGGGPDDEVLHDAFAGNYDQRTEQLYKLAEALIASDLAALSRPTDNPAPEPVGVEEVARIIRLRDHFESRRTLTYGGDPYGKDADALTHALALLHPQADGGEA